MGNFFTIINCCHRAHYATGYATHLAWWKTTGRLPLSSKAFEGIQTSIASYYRSVIRVDTFGKRSEQTA